MRGMTKRSGNRQQRDRNALHPRVRRLAAGVGLLFAAALILAAMPPSVAATPIVVVLRPMANSSLIEWSKSGGGGKNFDRVDEATSDGDATYVYTSTGADDDAYELQDLPSGGTIDFVRMHVVARRSAGDCDGTITREACIQHGVSYNDWSINGGNSFPLSSTYSDTVTTWNYLPFSFVPWTVADVNAARPVLMKFDSTSTVRVTQVWFEVQMTPTTTIVSLRPNANGYQNDWSKSGGGGKNFDRVDEATSDGDATYVYTSRAAFDVYALQDLSFAGTIDFVRLKAVARLSSGICQVGTVVYPGCFTMGITIDGPSWYQNRFVLNSTYATYSHTYTVNPWTGQAWTVAQVNALKVIINQNDGESTVRVTQFWAEVQFTPTG